MKTTKTLNDTPAPGHALLERTQDSFRRSTNGAWLPGSSTTETFEIPLETLNSTQGCGWLNPGRCGHVTLKFEDGSFLSVCGANDPIRTNGFGELGILTLPCLYGNKTVEERFVSAAHPLLPNLFAGYYRVEYHTDDVVKTFEPVRDYVITYRDAAGAVVDTQKTGPFGVTRGFAEHVAKSGLITRSAAVSFEISQA